MIKGKTKSGFEFEIEEAVVDDMRFLEDLASVVNGNALIIPEVTTKMLGKEQKEALYKHLEDENGRVPIKAFEDAFTEIFESATALKN